MVGGRLSALELNIGRFGTLTGPTQLDIGPVDFSHLASKNLLKNQVGLSPSIAFPCWLDGPSIVRHLKSSYDKSKIQ